MRLLIVHQNFPAQFAPVALAWQHKPGWDVRALGRDSAPGLPGFDRLLRYQLARKGRQQQHPYLRQLEAATLHGQAAARAMLRLRSAGFTPDVILAHPGWGETLYARDVFPQARLVHLCEWYYAAEGADLGFDPEFPIAFDDRARIRTWNALHALNLEQCDAAVAPTEWQRSRHPAVFRDKISVCHEGIAVGAFAPDPAAVLRLSNGVVLRAGDPVVTYVSRNLEPYRGFHVFMRALERMQRHHKRLHALVIGGNDVSYGKRPKGFANWRDRMLSEVTIDPARTHFLGRVPKAAYARALQISAAHVYLTYPFVLSWSLLEAMASAAPIVASATAPVREVLRDGDTARLVDFFAVERLADAVLETLADRAEARATGERARLDARRYDQALGIAGYEALVKEGGASAG